MKPVSNPGEEGTNRFTAVMPHPLGDGQKSACKAEPVGSWSPFRSAYSPRFPKAENWEQREGSTMERSIRARGREGHRDMMGSWGCGTPGSEGWNPKEDPGSMVHEVGEKPESSGVLEATWKKGCQGGGGSGQLCRAVRRPCELGPGKDRRVEPGAPGPPASERRSWDSRPGLPTTTLQALPHSHPFRESVFLT